MHLRNTVEMGNGGRMELAISARSDHFEVYLSLGREGLHYFDYVPSARLRQMAEALLVMAGTCEDLNAHAVGRL